LVVDPGPLDAGHLESVLRACGGRIADIVLTHRHHDHADGATELASMGCCRIRAADPRLDTTGQPLADGDELTVPGATVRVHATPGHTGDSVSLLVRGADAACRLLTGDTVLGRGTTVITRPDGSLRAYLMSLDLLESLVRDERVAEILPGHGPPVGDPLAWLAHYRTHRLERLQQVRAALAAGDRTPAEVVARVYADVDRSVWPAAEESVAA
jgi:glyoxylase-like metal-dependent hydrolase (beta-lactamase superfamily II)